MPLDQFGHVDSEKMSFFHNRLPMDKIPIYSLGMAENQGSHRVMQGSSVSEPVEVESSKISAFSRFEGTDIRPA
jgi:hypothetical protein